MTSFVLCKLLFVYFFLKFLFLCLEFKEIIQSKGKQFMQSFIFVRERIELFVIS